MPITPLRSSNPDLRNFPDFMILGPQRTGTTWLYFNLHLHPEILMHRMKETYFFSSVGKPPHPRCPFQTLEDYLESFNESAGEKLRKHYTSLRKSLTLYRPRIRGEASASYALLEDELIAEIVGFRRDLKGILMLRHPVERAWSHAKKTLVRDRSESAPITLDAFRDYLKSSGQRQRAGYRGMIERWRKHLQPGHLYLGRYDRIASEPAAFLADIERFLGVTTRALFFNRHLTIKLNPTSDLGTPPEIETFLRESLGPDIDSYEEIVREVGDGKAV
ncbi:MAG: sulfotransferase [Terrimicrobiaceae bacterium]|nr:sulfotransferase [Terrimicrobiaceae bacterium]